MTAFELEAMMSKGAKTMASQADMI